MRVSLLRHREILRDSVHKKRILFDTQSALGMKLLSIQIVSSCHPDPVMRTLCFVRYRTVFLIPPPSCTHTSVACNTKKIEFDASAKGTGSEQLFHASVTQHPSTPVRFRLMQVISIPLLDTPLDFLRMFRKVSIQLFTKRFSVTCQCADCRGAHHPDHDFFIKSHILPHDATGHSVCNQILRRPKPESFRSFNAQNKRNENRFRKYSWF